MANNDAIMALAKVLIAAAWADGKVAHEELNSLKDLLFRLPEMTAQDWAELDIYLEAPVGEAERARLVEELRRRVSSTMAKNMAIEALEEVIGADGELSDDERAVISEIKETLESGDINLMGKLGRLMNGGVQRRSQALINAPNRERYLEDFTKNRVFYNLRLRLELDEANIDLPEAVLRKLGLAGGLMARVAYVDREINEDEITAMVDAIQQHWDLTTIEATLVAEVAVDVVSRNMDYYRLSREFFESTTEDERVHFMDILFAVASGDGFVSYEEIEEIRTIATVLKLTHKQFIDAKLKIPREHRSS